MMRKEKNHIYIYTTCDLNPGPYISGHVLLTTMLLGAWTKSTCRYSTWNLDKRPRTDTSTKYTFSLIHMTIIGNLLSFRVIHHLNINDHTGNMCVNEIANTHCVLPLQNKSIWLFIHPPIYPSTYLSIYITLYTCTITPLDLYS